MDSRRLELMLQDLRQRVSPPRANVLSDGQLLERFAGSGDDAAFELLVRRYGPLVWSVCRRVLGNAHDADDAFQAAFLVLVRKAGSLEPRGSVAGWLHGVAYRVAAKARVALARRRTHEMRNAGPPVVVQDSDPASREFCNLLDEELARLPEKYRLAVVVCCLQGKTHAEAAAELGWPLGTLKCRLLRGREQLRQRLARRGVVLSTGLLAAFLAEAVARGAVPAALVNATLRSSLLFAAGSAAAAGQVPVAAVALAEGVLQTMAMTKLKMVAGILLLLCTIGSGVGVAAYGVGFSGTAAVAPASSRDLPGAVAAEADKRDQVATPAALEGAWTDLAGTDETKAMRAIVTLAAAPKDTVPFLKEHLKPVTVDAKRIARLIGDLDSETFAVRQKATDALEAMGEYAVQYLRGALDGTPPLDVKKRIEAILEKIKSGGHAPSSVRAVRAIAVLESFGTADARQILEVLARGRAKALPTQEAEAALDRLTERPVTSRQRQYEDLVSADEGRVARALLALAATPKETVQLLDEEVQKRMKAPPPPKGRPEARAELLKRIDEQSRAAGNFNAKPAPPSNETVTKRVSVLLEHIGTPEARKLLETIQQKKVALGAPDAGGTSVVSPDGRILATVDDQGAIHVSDVATGKQLWRHQGPKAVSVAFSADGTMLIAKDSAGKVTGLDVATGKALFVQEAGR